MVIEAVNVKILLPLYAGEVMYIVKSVILGATGEGQSSTPWLCRTSQCVRAIPNKRREG